MLQGLPELLRHVRGKGGNHQHECFDGLLQHRNGLRPDGRAKGITWIAITRNGRTAGPSAEGVQLVDELHQPRHCGIEVHTRVEVQRDPPDGVVSLPSERTLALVQLQPPRRGNAFTAHRLTQPVNQTPHARQEPEAPLEPRVCPLDLLFGRGNEHHVEPQGIGAVLLDHVVGIHHVPLRLRHDLSLFQHHSLREQPRERLVEVRQAHIPKDATEKPGVDQVENRMLHAAAVEVHRAPVGDLLRLERQTSILRVREPEKVPGGVDERIHRVRLAARRASALGTRRVDELRDLGERRIPPPGELGQRRQLHRQAVVWNRNHPARLAVHDRDRRAPVSLARNAPVLQPELRRALPEPEAHRLRGERSTGLFGRGPVVRPGPHQHAVFLERGGQRVSLERIAVFRCDDHANREVVLAGELEIPRVVRRNSHHGSGAVLHQNEVRHPDRNGLAREGVDDRAPRVEAFLLDVPGHAGRAVL